MPIRRGSLWRPCKKCGKSFRPTGRANRVCPKCSGLGLWLKKYEKTITKTN